jgi:CheY-like chemotaxis protein
MSEGKKHILIIDADDRLVDTARIDLEGAGYQVSGARQPEAGLALARETRPDLILLDIALADRFQAEAAAPTRRQRHDPGLRDVPLIILSGVTKMLDMPLADSPAEAYPAIRSFLEKPFQPQQLLSQVRDVLGQNPNWKR